jgi:hypothetical protein
LAGKKPKPQRGRQRRGSDIIAPPDERWQHGLVERERATIQDVDGAIGRPFRALGTLDLMLRHGSITREMFGAGERFHGQFVLASLEPLKAADPTRLPVPTFGTRHYGPHGSEHARNQVMQALSALGGPDTHLGSCAWHVLGRELSLREWCVHRGWNHRPTNFASGILVGVLELLRVHYFEPRRARN